MAHRFCSPFVMVLGLVAVSIGCGEPEPTRYPIKGSITWHGEPVAAGYLIFTPDTSKGNAGPGAQVEIKQGHYETNAVAGPLRVSIHGFDGQAYQDGNVTVANGRPLFAEQRAEVELSEESPTIDFSLP